MSKKDEALKLALESLEDARTFTGAWPAGAKAITAISEALMSVPDGAHAPEVREQPAQQDMPKIGCVNHDCDQCKARQQQEHVSLMTVLHLKDRTEIGYGPASAGYDLPTGEYKLYTSPPIEATPLASQRSVKPWVGLTQKDIDIAFDDTQEGGGFDEFARAIEAKLKEKNGF